MPAVDYYNYAAIAWNRIRTLHYYSTYVMKHGLHYISKGVSVDKVASSISRQACKETAPN